MVAYRMYFIASLQVSDNVNLSDSILFLLAYKLSLLWKPSEITSFSPFLCFLVTANIKPPFDYAFSNEQSIDLIWYEKSMAFSYTTKYGITSEI
jgi:hypothetical protein